ncbi:hypothetical protein ABTZ57_11705 [Streptomyces sp. NPDC094048]|uniref:hypothetical protein n=1 Tax=Streptomyces sp. NPDC094048 TaxID=3155207 RepID=UPI003328CF70
MSNTNRSAQGSYIYFSEPWRAEVAAIIEWAAGPDDETPDRSRRDRNDTGRQHPTRGREGEA